MSPTFTLAQCLWEGERNVVSVRQRSFLELGCFLWLESYVCFCLPSQCLWVGVGRVHRDKEAFQTKLPAIAGSCVLLPPWRQGESQTWYRKRIHLLATYFSWGSCDNAIYKKYIFGHTNDHDIFLIYIWSSFMFCASQFTKMLRISQVTRAIIESILCHNI